MLVTMSDKEIHRLPVIQAVCENVYAVVMQRHGLLHFRQRQAQRLINRYRVSGAEGLVSRKRGQPSNRRLTESLKMRVLTLIRENYSDLWTHTGRRKAQRAPANIPAFNRDRHATG